MKASQAIREVNGSNMEPAHIALEIDELKHALTADPLDAVHVLEELADVTYFVKCFLAQESDIDQDLGIGDYSYDKFMLRIDLLTDLFLQLDIPFSKSLLVEGSNFTKDEKLDRIIELACAKSGKKLTDELKKKARDLRDTRLESYLKSLAALDRRLMTRGY